MFKISLQKNDSLVFQKSSPNKFKFDIQNNDISEGLAKISIAQIDKAITKIKEVDEIQLELCEEYFLKLEFLIEDADATEIENLQFRPGLYDQRGEKKPVIQELKIIPGVHSAKIMWNQNPCYKEYELLIVDHDNCNNSEHCLEKFNSEIHSGTNNPESTNSFDVGSLERCAQYTAIIRAGG